MPSSTRFGARPRAWQTRVYSSGVSPWRAASTSVTGASMTSMSRRHRGCALQHTLAVRRTHGFEELQTVVAAQDLFCGVLGVGHEPEDVAAPIHDAGDVVERAVRVAVRGGPTAGID